MVRFLNYQHFFDFKISTPMLKNEKLKKLCIRHHKRNKVEAVTQCICI